MPHDLNLKYHFYTLSCRSLLLSLPKLEEVTSADTSVTWDYFIATFNSVLKTFLSAEMSTEPEAAAFGMAANRLSSSFNAQANFFEDSNSEAAGLLRSISQDILQQQQNWSPWDHVCQLHDKGREVAQLLYEPSLWPATQALLEETRPWVLDYASSAKVVTSMGYAQEKVWVRFSYDADFTTYLAYIYLFCHEYSSHIFGRDHEASESFNDGWLVYAAAKFLRNYAITNEDTGVQWAQAEVFVDSLKGDLTSSAAWGARLAERFDACVSGEFPYLFDHITYELAAFQPDHLAGRDVEWPQKFLIKLRKALAKDPAQVLKKIRICYDPEQTPAECACELMRIL